MTVRLLGTLMVAFAVGCSTTSSVGADAGTDAGMLDATLPNSCTNAGPAYVCQASACGAGFVNIQDYSCGSSSDFCCAPEGDGGLDFDNDADIFVDGAVFETGVDSGHDSGVDAAHDAGHDAGGSADAGPHPDGSSQDATDAGSDGSADATHD